MKLLEWLKSHPQRQNENSQRKNKALLDNTPSLLLSDSDDFLKFGSNNVLGDTYLLHAWVNIAVNILTRNIARADFTVKREGNDIECGAVYDLFRKPNPSLSRYDLWKETAAWWNIEVRRFGGLGLIILADCLKRFLFSTLEECGMRES